MHSLNSMFRSSSPTLSLADFREHRSQKFANDCTGLVATSGEQNRVYCWLRRQIDAPSLEWKTIDSDVTMPWPRLSYRHSTVYIDIICSFTACRRRRSHLLASHLAAAAATDVAAECCSTMMRCKVSLWYLPRRACSSNQSPSGVFTPSAIYYIVTSRPAVTRTFYQCCLLTYLLITKL